MFTKLLGTKAISSFLKYIYVTPSSHKPLLHAGSISMPIHVTTALSLLPHYEISSKSSAMGENNVICVHSSAVLLDGAREANKGNMRSLVTPSSHKDCRSSVCTCVYRTASVVRVSLLFLVQRSLQQQYVVERD